MREQLDDASGGMRVNAEEDVSEVVDGVDVVLFARGDECVEDGEVVAGVLVSDEEVILTTERDAGRLLRCCCPGESWRSGGSSRALARC